MSMLLRILNSREERPHAQAVINTHTGVYAWEHTVLALALLLTPFSSWRASRPVSLWRTNVSSLQLHTDFKPLGIYTHVYVWRGGTEELPRNWKAEQILKIQRPQVANCIIALSDLKLKHTLWKVRFWSAQNCWFHFCLGKFHLKFPEVISQVMM